jgi:hypothetical protein
MVGFYELRRGRNSKRQVQVSHKMDLGQEWWDFTSHVDPFEVEGWKNWNSSTELFVTRALFSCNSS